MNLDRLKFAWARGARIQRFWTDAGPPAMGGAWVTLCDIDPIGNPYATLRIHPDDAHLEYGPLSSALRDWSIYLTSYSAEKHERLCKGHLSAARQIMLCQCTVDPSLNLKLAEHDFDMSCLFFAEYLADQGL